MSGLPPGEVVIKDSGMFPVTWAKGTFSNINGKLILTNRRLIFTAGRFQDVIGAIRGAHKNRAEIPLNQITMVEKGFMATIKVHAGQEYTFKGMRDAGGWVSQINTARMTTGTVQGVVNQVRNVLPTPLPPSGSKFCTNCGAAAVPGNKFCGSCGARLS